MADFIIILLLIIFNGLFSMAETAIIAARSARLQPLADKNNKRAQAALKLVEAPAHLLSTVQVGITLIGILTGVFSGASVAAHLSDYIAQVTLLEPYADVLAFGIIILITTYLSLIIGELVPKSLALRNPEQIAMLVAQPMQVLTRIGGPMVTLLSISTSFVVSLLGQRHAEEPPVTEAEITHLLQQGVNAGIFVVSEQELVQGIFRLGDRRVSSLMTPRIEVDWIEVSQPSSEVLPLIQQSGHAWFPLCVDDLDHVVGVVSARDVLLRLISAEPFDLQSLAHDPLFVPETIPAARVLAMFQESRRDMVMVVNEHGGLDGIVTLKDLIDEVVPLDDDEQSIQRADGSWLLDGLMPIHDLKDLLEIESTLPGEGSYETLGGLMMAMLEHIPRTSEAVSCNDFRFEVVDMDGNRVDKVLVTRDKSNQTLTTTSA